MRVLPRTTPELLTFCTAILERWAADPAAIGLDAGQIAAAQQALEEARAAVLAQAAAYQAARAATDFAHTRLADLRGLMGGAVGTIRAFAETSAAPPEIYALAQIPLPSPGAPLPPPARPARLDATLHPSTGHIALSWRARNPRGSGGGGTTYLVRRRLPGESAPVFLGVGAKKRFTDTTLPAGIPWAQYTVQGHRAGTPGPLSDILTVNLGAQGIGAAAHATPLPPLPRAA